MAKDSKDIGRAGQAAEEPLTVEPHYELGSFCTVYSNFASISHTKDDICIDFCLVAPPHMVDIGEKTARVPVVARVVIPPVMAEGLINALKIQKEALSKDGEKLILRIKKPKEGTKK